MPFHFRSLKGKSDNAGSGFGFDQDTPFASPNNINSSSKRSTSSASSERSIHSFDHSSPESSTAKFGTGSLRRSSSFHLDSFGLGMRNGSSSSLDSTSSRNRISPNSSKLPDLKFDLSKSALTTPSSTAGESTDANKPQRHRLSLFQSAQPLSEIKKLIINSDFLPSNAIVRGKRRFQKNQSHSKPNPHSVNKNANYTSSLPKSTPKKNKKSTLSIPLGTPLRTPPTPSKLETTGSEADSGYWINPSLDTLFSYTFDQLKSVKDLQIGRKNNGTIRYIDPVDLSTIKNLKDIFEKLVVFDHLTVSVYPDESDKKEKTPPGTELNKPAVITLENVFIKVPVGDSKLKLTDPADPRVKAHTERFNERIKARGGEFVTYDAVTGIYVFKVDHFSSWGFNEEDLIYDDDDVEMNKYQVEYEGTDISSDSEGRLNGSKNAFTLGVPLENGHSGFMLSSPNQRYSQQSPSEFATKNGASRLNVFSNDLFGNNSLVPLSQETATDASDDDASLNDGRRSSVDTMIQHDYYRNKALELYEHANNEPSVADSWIDQLSYAANFDSTLATPTTEPGSTKIKSDAAGLFRKPNINASDLDNAVFGGTSQMQNSSIVGQYQKAAVALRLPEPFVPFSFAKFSSSWFILKNEKSPSSFSNGSYYTSCAVSSQVQNILHDLLENSQINSRDTGFPLSKPSGPNSFDYLRKKFANSSRGSDVFSLASVLFDNLEVHGIKPLPESLPQEAAKKQTETYRAQLLSQWLSNIVASDMQKQLASSRDPLSQALTYLYGNEITKSAVAASKGGNLHLAALIPLLGSPDEDIKLAAQSQIKEWQASGVLGYIPVPVRTIYELIAGNTCVSKGLASSHDTKAAPTLHISQGLSWLQAFGLRLWYESTTHKPISEAVKYYEGAFMAQNSTVPNPFVGSNNVQNVEFQLLSLYSSPDSQFLDLFNPLSTSGNSFDYQISWLLYYVLVKSLGLFQDPGSKIGSLLSLEFAAQLESQRKYVEAVFALSHISQDFYASQEIEQLITRNISDLTTKDIDTLVNKLKISPAVFSNARALKLRYQGDYWNECQQLIIAGNFEEAHYRLLNYVAPQAVISNNLDKLLTLLLSFKSPEVINGWSKGGQVYLDYIYVFEEMSSKRQRLTSEKGDVEIFSKSPCTKATADRARQAYANSGLSAHDVGLRLMKGLGEIDFFDSFDIKVSVNLMAAFISKNIKPLGLEDNASLALQMKVDSLSYRQQAMQLSGFYLRDKTSSHGSA